MLVQAQKIGNGTANLPHMIHTFRLLSHVAIQRVAVEWAAAAECRYVCISVQREAQDRLRAADLAPQRHRTLSSPTTASVMVCEQSKNKNENNDRSPINTGTSSVPP